MKKVKIGVLGAGRGKTMMKYCLHSQNAELVAVCDFYEPFLEDLKKMNEKENEEMAKGITYYTDFEEFIKHDMDAVVLANFANEHAPYAVRCMKEGKHVMSEVLAFQNVKEAVDLIEAVEETGKIYAYAENYCYMPAPREMRRLKLEGKLGKIEYAEGEYLHNCEPIWDRITYGLPEHWRNKMSGLYYCTHSIGPMIHIAGERPVKVSGFEVAYNDRCARMGALGSPIGLAIITLENGAVLKSVHGVGPYTNSVWYSVYGSDGRAESAREATDKGIDTLYLMCDDAPYEGNIKYRPTEKLSAKAASAGHGGSDFYTMYFFCEKILGDEEAEIVDVYEATDMMLAGLFAYRSCLNNNASMEIPNLRLKSERDKWRNDTATWDENFAGDMLQPSYSESNPEVPDEVYEYWRKKWADSYGQDRKYRY
ncbi:MAG: Gfo/Idh/MocA family oxidoreductase [Clostridia bacterium]|nr:Gfo/Idh/MocA family oxidoreductase [Clostridia bacterium]